MTMETDTTKRSLAAMQEARKAKRLSQGTNNVDHPTN